MPTIAPILSTNQPRSEHLHAPPGQSLDIDGNTPFLADASGIGREELEQNQAVGASSRPHTGKRFVGGFVVGLKKAANSWGTHTGLQPPEQPPQTPAAPVPTWTSIPANAGMPDPHPSSPVPSGSPTVHGYSDEAYAASETLVHHQNAGSPEAILVEPLPAPDYIKQTHPPRAFDRIQKFFHDLNKLPWVARDRVTSDYTPKRRSTRPLSSSSYPYTASTSAVTAGEGLPIFSGGHLNTQNLLASPSSESSNKHFQRMETPLVVQAPTLPTATHPSSVPRSVMVMPPQPDNMQRFPNGYTTMQPVEGAPYAPPSSSGHGYVKQI